MFHDIIKSLGGIIRAPGNTLGNLMKEKKWLPLFLLILLTVALYTNITLSLRMNKAAENPWVSEYFPGEQLVDFQSDITLLKRIMVTSAALFGITLNFIIGAFFLYLFFGIAGSEGYYTHFFTLVVNASLIDTLLPLVRDVFSIFLKINLGAITNLLILFPSLKPLSLDFWLVSQVEFFFIWYLVAIAAGVSVFAGMKLKKCLFISFLYFLFKSVISAFTSYLGIKILVSMMSQG